MKFHHSLAPRRAAFTLTEMLMAIAIIVVLIALAAAAVLKFMDTGPYNATAANLAKIKAALDTQWKAVTDKAMRDSIPTNFSQNPTAGGERDRFVQARLAQAFPISFAEIINPPSSLGAWPPYLRYLNSELGITTVAQANAVPPGMQQSICLLMILERGPSSSGLNASNLGTSAVNQLTLPNDGRANACVDAWGRPLWFSRNFEGKPNTLGIVSAGANNKLGVQINLGNAVQHTLQVNNALEAEDNVIIPDNR